MKRPLDLRFRISFCVSIVLFLQLAARGQSDALHLPQLDKPVRILVDSWGVPHIYAETEHDLFFAQGFQAASDRLFQFEIFRRRATGTMAEALGPGELKRDIGSRLFQFRGNMDDELAHYHPRGRSIIQAFVDGINAYTQLVLDGRRPMPFELQVLGIRPGFWTPEVVVSRHNGLLMNVQRELSMARHILHYGEQRMRDLQLFSPRQPDLRIDPEIKPEDLQDPRILAPYNAFRANVQFPGPSAPSKTAAIFSNHFTIPPTATVLSDTMEPGLASTSVCPDEDPGMRRDADGSNNWVISGQRSASGFPLMGNDPHRVVAMPSLRYMVHLEGAGWNVIGGGEPTLPGVSIGHNDYGAWGLTIFETDAEDLYVYRLKAGDPSRYWYKGEWRAFRQVRDTIPVHGAAAEAVTLQYSVHGPVTFVDTARGKAYAVRCGWLEKGSAPYLASLRMGQARNWTEFREACTYSFIPAENMVWADKQGHIGWQAVGIAPIRKTHSGLVPVPGDGRYDWQGFLPVKDLPSAYNPSAGFFSTANEENIPQGYRFPEAVGYTWAEAYRQLRIQDVLTRNRRVSMTDMERLQTDWYSEPAAQLVPLLRQVDLQHPLAKLGRQMLLSWDYRLDPGSRAASVYIGWEYYIERALLRGMQLPLDSTGAPGFHTARMIGYLSQPADPFWKRYGMHRDTILKQALFTAVADLASRLGPDTAQWQYGQERMKHVQLKHPLDGLHPEGLSLSTGSWPRGGNGNTVASTGDNRNQDFGASFRILVDCADWDAARAINTPGQSGDPRSPHFKDLFELWKENRYFPLYFSKEKVASATVRQQELLPGR